MVYSNPGSSIIFPGWSNQFSYHHLPVHLYMVNSKLPLMKKCVHFPALLQLAIGTGFLVFFIPFTVVAQNTIPFDTAHWDLTHAKRTVHLGREAITGTATLKDIPFQNGVIEVDIATIPDTCSYPGIIFRKQDPFNYERIYLRPHRSNFYKDALQYAPSFHGMDSWQLYNGPGKSSALEIPSGEWNHLKIIVSGDRADVYWNHSETPALVIDKLDHGISEGVIELMNSQTGSAFYSDFSIQRSDTLKLPPAVLSEPVCGIISNWELSSPYPLVKVDFNGYPSAELVSRLTWQPVIADENGMVDVSRYHSRKSQIGDCIMAKTTLLVEKDTIWRVGFGYSDYITVYLNQTPVFSGNSAYSSRDNSFLGIIGYFDYLFLPLRKGVNELMVQVGETMGGWAFCFRNKNEIFLHPSVQKAFTLKEGISIPEAILCDPQQDVCYVSNYFCEGNESLSKLSPDGKVIEAEWITGLRMPAGMCLDGHLLYVVDRTGLNVIDTRNGTLMKKIPLPGMQMPNDVAIDGEGNIYITDTPANALFRYADGNLEPWMGSDLLQSPNALLVDGDHLLIGQNEKLVSVAIADKKITTLVLLERGSNVDGIQSDGQGHFLISDFRGKLYRISPEGSKDLLINTATPGDYSADFAFIPGKKLILIPTLTTNSITGYLLAPD